MAAQTGIRLRQALCLVFLVLSVMACSDDSSRARLKEFDGDTQGTTYHIKVVDLPATLSPETVRTAIEAELDDITRHLSTYTPDSELSRFNRSRDTGWFPASTGLVQVLSEARQISELSQGAYDVTVARWSTCGVSDPRIPVTGFLPSTEIAAAQARIGYTHLGIRPSPPAIRKDIPDLTVDVASIAQGYTVDRVAERLESLGIANYLVEIGGELRGKGLNQLGGHWRIGIERPAPGERAGLHHHPHRRCRGIDLGRLSRLFRTRRTALLAYHQPADGPPRIAPAGLRDGGQREHDARRRPLHGIDGPRPRGRLSSGRTGRDRRLLHHQQRCGFTDRETTAFDRHRLKDKR